MADTELLPCPFCGSEHVALIHNTSSDHRYDWDFAVECECGAKGESDKSEEHAAIVWNRRAALASRPAEVDDEGLPPLPKGIAVMTEFPHDQAASRYYTPYRPAWLGSFPPTGSMLYTAEQLRQGQRDAVAADRARFGGLDGLMERNRMSHFEKVLRKIATVNAMDYEYRSWAIDAIEPPENSGNEEN